MKRHIPNLITSCNVMCGTTALFAVMYGQLQAAALFIIFGMIFDFFDGMVARLLHVKSEIGKELDSLADVVSFGVAPAMLAHQLIKWSIFGDFNVDIFEATVGEWFLLLSPILIPAFSAYRLPKFNLDTRQTSTFIGMPTPANALFWVALVFGYFYQEDYYNLLFNHPVVLVIIMIIMSILLISELPMFSLKLSGFGFKENKIQYLYFITLILLFILLGWFAILLIIPLYIFVSAIDALIKR